MNGVNIKDKLSLDAFKPDNKSHLEVDRKVCENCGKPCLHLCPAGVYQVEENGGIRVQFEACLECGACLVGCPHNAIKWDYPRGGFGVQFRYG